MNPKANRHPEGRKLHPKDWKPVEVAAMYAHYPAGSWEELFAALPGRSKHSIARWASKHRLAREINVPGAAWTEKELNVMYRYYKASGIHAVASRTGRSANAVKMCAVRLGLTSKVRGRRISVKPKAVDVAKPKLAKLKVVKPTKPKSAPKPVIVAPEPVKRSPATPILNARVEQRRLIDKQREQKPKPFVTADQIRSLSATHPARLAWTRAAYHGPQAATDAFYAALNQSKQAA